MTNKEYIRSMQGHAKLIDSYTPQFKLSLLMELEENGATYGNLDAAMDNLRGMIFDDRKAALIWSAVMAALGSDLEALRQRGVLKGDEQPNDLQAFKAEMLRGAMEAMDTYEPDAEEDEEDFGGWGDEEDEEDWE